ncbi:MAG: translation initiation factor IF-2 [Parachlamydiales bacterium]|nr:translation initiation factor IF-2 [Parachlamydiales bacterium]
MAKNLKINIKNTQLAEALNLGDLKSSVGKKLAKKKEKESAQETPEEIAPAPVASPTEEEPRRVKARHKTTAVKAEPVAEELPVEEPVSAAPVAEETKSSPEPIEAIQEAQPSKALEESVPVSEPTKQSVEEIPTIEQPVEKKEPPRQARPFEKKVGPRSDRPFEKRDPSRSNRPFEKRDPNRSARPFDRTRNEEKPKETAAPRPHQPFAAPDSPFSPRARNVPLDRAESPPRIKLGPTGRHVKDLLKPKPVEPAPVKKSGPPYAKKPGEARVNPRPGTPGAPRTTETTNNDATARKPIKAKDFKDVKPLRKQADTRTFDARDRQGLRDNEDGRWRKKRPSKMNRHAMEDTTIRPSSLKVRLPISVKDLAAEMKLKASQLVSKLFMQGIVITLNDLLDDETTIGLLGQEFACEITIDTSKAERMRITGKTIAEEVKETETDKLTYRAPVIAFMGHVDHGKTSLIDAIRSTNRAAGEVGAITQHIGAFRCTTPVGDLTILDTPGHEAFSTMRQRGATVTDIVVLVVAGDEGMRQQTIEALEQAREANVTIVVAINKSDKQGFDQEKIYKQLAEQNLLPEAWGGTTITVNCSALTKDGIPELLEMLALQAEILELKAEPTARARGTVLESEMHKGMGPVATILVQNGTLRFGDALVFGLLSGRIKTMHDDMGIELKEAGPSTPVKISGLSGLPEAGQEFIVVKNEREAKEIADARREEQRQTSLNISKRLNLDKLAQQAAAQQKKILNVILRADVQGSVEAVRASLMRIKSNKVELNVISASVGEVSESDVQLASASQAIIIGFHTQVESHAEDIIKQTGVSVHLYDVIYHAIDGVKDMMKSMLDKIEEERDVGAAEVKATFKASHLGVIAGCIVTEGSITRNNRIRAVRNGEVIWKGTMSSLKRVKEDVREVKKGLECGILLNNFNELLEGDILQAYELHYITQDL